MRTVVGVMRAEAEDGDDGDGFTKDVAVLSG